MQEFNKLFDSFATLKVGVIGDLMLDTYMFGRVDRISPEAPVPIVVMGNKEYRIGGAGNVALNCHSLGARVSVLSVIGDDTEGLLLEEMLRTNQIDTDYLVKTSSRPTTNKTRIISRNQQMMRLDSEITDDLGRDDEIKLLAGVRSFIEKTDPSIIIFEDYNKGVLTESLIQSVISLCKQAGVITAVDPKRKNFFSYKEVDIFKPNLKEVRQGLHLLFSRPDLASLGLMHDKLRSVLHHSISFITLSEQGVFYQDHERSSLINSHLRNIADVSGAGDTVIAVASMVYAATQNVHLMAEIANIAGGLVCEEVGTVAIDKERLRRECELLLS